MTPENTYKVKFNRKYWMWNPDKYAGPTTAILGSVVKPVPAPLPTP